MPTSASSVRFDDDLPWVDLPDGRVIGAPLAWFPRLLRSTAAERAIDEIGPAGVHRDALADISVEGLPAGIGDLTRTKTSSRPIGWPA